MHVFYTKLVEIKKWDAFEKDLEAWKSQFRYGGWGWETGQDDFWAAESMEIVPFSEMPPCIALWWFYSCFAF